MEISPQRLVKRVVQVLVGLELFYVALVNVMLSTGGLESLLNQVPAIVVIQFDSAYSLWPGMVRVQGLSIRSQDPSMQWIVTAERAQGNVDLLALPHMIFAADDVIASGVTFHLRFRQGDGPPPTPGTTPDIPGLSNPPNPKPEDFYTDPPRPWTIRLTGMDVTQLGDIWIEQYRFLGESRASGDLDIAPLDRVSIQNAKLQFESGGAFLGQQPVVQELTGPVQFTVGPFDPGDLKDRDFFRYLTAHAELKCEFRTLDFLNFYLKKTPWFSVAGGEGSLEADVKIQNGAFTEGSSLKALARKIVVDLKKHDASGSARIQADVAREKGVPMSTVQLDFDSFAVQKEGDKSPLVQGKGLKIVARSPDLKLTEPFTTVDLTMRLPDSEIPDTRLINGYLPENTGIGIGVGKGRMAGEIVLSTLDRSAAGKLLLSGSAVRASYGDLNMRGDLKLSAKFNCKDLAKSRCDLAGTVLDLNHISVIDDAPGTTLDQRGWWGQLAVRSGVVLLDKSPGVDVFLETSVRDTGPFVALFAEKQTLPPWLQKLLTLEGIKGTAHLLVEKSLLEVRGLKLSNPVLELGARIRRAKATQGTLYVRSGPFDVGLELKGDKKQWKLQDGKRWFEEHPSGQD